MIWKMLFILSFTGILSVPITKLNKASSGVPGDRGACLYKRLSKPNELLYLPSEIWRRFYLQERQKGFKEMSCRSRETQGKEVGVPDGKSLYSHLLSFFHLSSTLIF